VYQNIQTLSEGVLHLILRIINTPVGDFFTMYRKIIIIGLLIVLGVTITLSPAGAQFTDYNDHDPGVSSASIPSWIKNTAGWWASDSITETEFLRAIEYLIENKIIKITTSIIEDIPDITTTYTLPATRQAEFIQFTGGFEDKHTGPLTLTIILPDNSEQTITTISRDGTFSATMELTSDSKIGRYTVYAEIKGEQLLVSAFNVKDRNANKVPVWIKNNAQWWSENKITDSDFVKGIEYLVENRIIIVATEPSQAKPVPTGPGLTQDSCSGHARCFSGKVTKVTDGDTIRINEHSIRFALSSAPELGQTNGERAREFIDTICPVGTGLS